MTSTIFALATAPGRAAVAVMRLSGASVGTVVQAIAGKLPPPRQASLRHLRDDAGAEIDQALVLWMPAPASFTGEDCAELHLHGGTAVVEVVSARLRALGCCPAEPGAFTRRAFEHGKLDLLQAEAIADLVDAETEAQRRQALDQLSGSVSGVQAAWRARLTSVLARLEAAVDFPDEELPESLAEQTAAPMLALAAELRAASADRRGEQVRDGFRVALVGEPNVGKSSLFNALLGRDAAIVTATPGTTRDVIEASMVLQGRKVILADLAGLRETDDPIEGEGVRRARAWAETADLRLNLRTDRDPECPKEGPSDLTVTTKSDLGSREPIGMLVSAATGVGLEELRRAIGERAVIATTGASAPAATRERHRLALSAAASDLEAAALAASAPELAAEHARLAARQLALITGAIGAEAILAEVFATFCIGK